MSFRAESSRFLLFCSYLLFLSIISSAFAEVLASSSVASAQIEFWSENVLNKMPESISKKLSPLSKHDTYYYSEMISQNDFVADEKFCSIAKLVCSNKVVKVNTGPNLKGYNKYGATGDTSHPEHVNPSNFFRLSTLKQGNTIDLPNIKDSLPHLSFLPPQIMAKVSLCPSGIKKIFPETREDAINTTFSYCSGAGIKGEIKTCTKSLEEMVSFSRTALGQKNQLIALTSESTVGYNTKLQIENVKSFDTENIVACHEMLLPFSAFFCHLPPNTKVYSVDMADLKTRAPISTVTAVCHMDTSEWSADYIAFQMLKIGPGQGEVCHWHSETDLVWIAGGKNV